MSKITLDNLSDNLKEYLEGLGLSEEQVLNLINENGLDEEELKTMLKDTMSINELSTNSKTVIGAINELFQSANNGKELIANAIGEPLSSEDTFSAMSTDINSLLSTFKTNMMNNGVAVESSDRFKSLIDKIATLADSEGKGIQFTEGTFTITGNKSNYTVNMNLSFSPTYVFANIQNAIHISGAWSNGTVGYVSNLSKFGGDKDPIVMSNVSSESFTISVTSSDIWSNGFANGTYSWYAIGVGEEDTTLRDSLASILEDEGVDVTEEDDMASLITKVDNEFDNMNDEISNTRNKLADLLIESGIDITYEDDLNDLLTKLEGMIVIDSSASVNGIVTKVTEYIFEGIMDDYKEVVYLNHKIIGDMLFLVVNGRKDLSQNMYETSMAKYNLSTQSLEKIQQITQTNNGKYDSCYFLDDSVIFIYNLYEITQYSLDTFTAIKSIYRNSDINTTATPVFKLLHENYLFLFFNGYYRDAAKIFRLNLTNMTIDKQYIFNASLINYGNALMASSFIFIHDGYIYASGYYSGTATGYIAKLSFDLTLIEYSNSTTIANFGLAYIYNNRINGIYFVNYTDGVQLAVMTFDLGNNYAYEYNIYPTSDILASAGSNCMNAKFIDGDENHFYINYLGEVIKVNKQDFSIVREYNISSKDTIINISNNELSTISKDYISKYKFYN